LFGPKQPLTLLAGVQEEAAPTTRTHAPHRFTAGQPPDRACCLAALLVLYLKCNGQKGLQRERFTVAFDANLFERQLISLLRPCNVVIIACNDTYSCKRPTQGAVWEGTW